MNSAGHRPPGSATRHSQAAVRAAESLRGIFRAGLGVGPQARSLLWRLPHCSFADAVTGPASAQLWASPAPRLAAPAAPPPSHGGCAARPAGLHVIDVTASAKRAPPS